jgi:peptidoglycan/xylan/chitin deacetylase (PgdA/CDA1 family)
MLTVVKTRKRITEEPLICVKFDDGTGTDLTVVWPYFKSLGLVASFQVISSRVGKPETGGGRYEGQWADYKASIDDGFEICDHMYDHENVTTLTSTELHTNFQATNDVFIANGLPAPQHLTFPGGRKNDLAISIARQYRKSITTMVANQYETWEGIKLDRYNTLPSDVYNDDILPNRFAQIDKIKNEGLIGILSQHRITDTPGTSTSLSRTDLWYQWADYLAASGVRTVTFSELRNIIKEYKG